MDMAFYAKYTKTPKALYIRSFPRKQRQEHINQLLLPSPYDRRYMHCVTLT